MKIAALLMLFFLLSLNILFAQFLAENAPGFEHAEGPCLGQKPPGLIPERFAPGLVTTDRWEYGGVFTPDLNEFYYIREDRAGLNHEMVLLQKNGEDRWRVSAVSPREGQPFIAPDGKTMYLGSRYRERTRSGWSELKSIGPQFEDFRIMRLTVSSKGTYVFDEVGSAEGDGIIRCSQLINGKREAPSPISREINTGTFNAHPFLSPDETYLIWDSQREGGFGNSDLYISFRESDGTWGPAINLGDAINTAAWEAAASVTPDGKYLFFNRNMGSDNYENVDIFWVDAQVIENLRHKH